MQLRKMRLDLVIIFYSAMSNPLKLNRRIGSTDFKNI